MRLTGLALGSALAIAFAVVAVSSVSGQGPDVQITELDCTSDPEVVVIENRGEAAQALAGWRLESDPTDSEVYDLSVRGDLVAGASIRIQSGPSASGVFLQFNWGQEFVFRDNDPTDFARIVDDTGAVVDQVDCGGGVAPQPTPTPTPTPSPEPSPAGDVPNGGGPPPPSGDGLLAAMIVLVGGAIAAAGIATGAFSGLRLRSSLVAGTTATPAPREAGARPRGRDDPRGEPVSSALGLTLVGLVAAALALHLLRRRPR